MIVLANNSNSRPGGQGGTSGFPPVSRCGEGVQSCVAYQKIPNWTAEEYAKGFCLIRYSKKNDFRKTEGGGLARRPPGSTGLTVLLYVCIY